MARSPQALVEAEMLAWARKTRRMQVFVAAKRVGVSEQRITDWEAGTSSPTVVQLRKMAEVYKRPLAAFFMDEPPEDDPVPHDFRRLPDIDTDLSPELALEIRSARERQVEAGELAFATGFEPQGPSLRASADEPPAKVAKRVRDFLGVSLEDQFRARGEYGSLNLWKSALEGVGVLVFQASGVSVQEMRGFSIAHPLLPVVVINSKDAPPGRVFSLLHEFVHLILSGDGLCTFREVGADAVEVFCNAVAGLTLVPADELRRRPEVQGHGEGLAWDWIELRGLARTFGVSKEVILRRLLDQGMATRDEYREYRRQQEEHARQQPKKPKSTGGPDYYVAKKARLGRPFIELVLTAFHTERITATEAAGFLGVKADRLSRLESAVFG